MSQQFTYLRVQILLCALCALCGEKSKFGALSRPAIRIVLCSRPENAGDRCPCDTHREHPRPTHRVGRVDLRIAIATSRVGPVRRGGARSAGPAIHAPIHTMPIMRLKWILLYLKYRRYIVPALVVLGLAVAIY